MGGHHTMWGHYDTAVETNINGVQGKQWGALQHFLVNLCYLPYVSKPYANSTYTVHCSQISVPNHHQSWPHIEDIFSIICRTPWNPSTWLMSSTRPYIKNIVFLQHTLGVHMRVLRSHSLFASPVDCWWWLKSYLHVRCTAYVHQITRQRVCGHLTASTDLHDNTADAIGLQQVS